MKLKIKLLSDMNITTGESRGGNIDSDIYIDQYGLPYLPAKRIKGIIRDTSIFMDNLLGRLGRVRLDINYLFGETGKIQSAITISNALIEDYDDNVAYLRYCLSEVDNNNQQLISVENIIEHFTITRINTAIDDRGTAKDGSLRTIRVLHRDLIFESEITIPDIEFDLFTIVIESVKYIGSNKTRGFGRVECWLDQNGKRIDTSSVRRELST